MVWASKMVCATILLGFLFVGAISVAHLKAVACEGFSNAGFARAIRASKRYNLAKARWEILLSSNYVFAGTVCNEA